MPEPFDDEKLDRLLREEEPYLSNDGFSDRVLEAIPGRRSLSWRARRRLIKGLSAFAGVATASAIVFSNGVAKPVAEALAKPILLPVAMIALFVAIGATCVWVMSDRA